jgi:hypothetical protein
VSTPGVTRELAFAAFVVLVFGVLVVAPTAALVAKALKDPPAPTCCVVCTDGTAPATGAATPTGPR